ncbi:MAG: hypothetical protein EOO77_44140 [Oxalobacteraceae bacterium]|nr:MAG: hypothetical protein EOO77_44140 [Oxalobacteraceae bacterium]
MRRPPHLDCMRMIEVTRASTTLAKVEEAAEKARLDRIDKWKRSIAAAEAKAVAAKLPARLYQANYRVADRKSEKQGNADERRSALVELIRSLAPKERHQGTSTWVFQLHIADAVDVANLLASPLDAGMDLLSVAEIGVNRTILGKMKLAS